MIGVSPKATSQVFPAELGKTVFSKPAGKTQEVKIGCQSSFTVILKMNKRYATAGKKLN